MSSNRIQSVEKVDLYLNKHGFVRLSDYLGARASMTVRAKCGHVIERSLWGIQRGVNQNQRCHQCNLVDQETVVIDVLIAAGCTPISIGKYKGNKDPYEWLCPKGHLVQSSYNQYTVRPKYHCCIECSSGVLTEENIKSILNGQGCTYIGYTKVPRISKGVQVGFDKAVEYICPKGHTVQSRLGNIKNVSNQNGYICKTCSDEVRRRDKESQLLFEQSGVLRRRINRQIRNRIQDLERGLALKKSKTALAKQLIERYGFPPEGYHIDHIIPISFFDIRIPAELEACWSVENLRYLPGRENVRRSNRLTREEFEMFTEAQRKILSIASLKPLHCDLWLQSS